MMPTYPTVTSFLCLQISQRVRHGRATEHRMGCSHSTRRRKQHKEILIDARECTCHAQTPAYWQAQAQAAQQYSDVLAQRAPPRVCRLAASRAAGQGPRTTYVI